MNHIENYQNTLKEFENLKNKLNPQVKNLKSHNYWSFFINELLDNGFIDCFNSYYNISLIDEIEEKIIPQLNNLKQSVNLREDFIKDSELILLVTLKDKQNFFDMKHLLSFEKQYADLMNQKFDLSFLKILMKVTKHCALEHFEIETNDFLINIEALEDEKNLLKIMLDKFAFMHKLNQFLFDYISIAQNDWLEEKLEPQSLMKIDNSLNDLSRVIHFYEKAAKSNEELISIIKEKINISKKDLEDMHSGDCTAFPASCMRCYAEEKFGLPSSVTFGKNEGYSMYARYINILKILPILKEASDMEESIGIIEENKKKSCKL